MAGMKITDNKKEFIKERNRLIKAIKKAEKEGFIFPEDIVPELPKRVTQKAIENIKAIKPKQLRLQGTRIDLETGEILEEPKQRISSTRDKVKPKKDRKGVKGESTYTRVRKKRKSKPPLKIKEKAEYPQKLFTDEIRNALERMQRRIPPPLDYSMYRSSLVKLLDDTIAFYKDDEEQYANYIAHLKANEERIFDIIYVMEWNPSMSQEQLERTVVELATILNFGALSFRQAEEMSEFTEQAVYYQDEWSQ